MNVRANKILLLVTSVASLALLVTAAYRENVLQEWRRIQRRYASALPAAERSVFREQLRQVVVPALGVTDRCVTCHIGMAPGETAVAADPLFRAHPRMPHDPSEFGCTVCHGGQGRATETAAAHGTVHHWPEPMIPLAYADAGCGSCHTHLAVPSRDALAAGSAMFERYDCLACHRVDRRGGTLRPGGAGGMEGPDLSAVGATGFDERWYASHLARAEEDPDPRWRASFAEIPVEDRTLLDEYLRSRVGAPALVDAKAVFHSRGCRGCHAVGGLGGDDGPDLTRIGQRDPGQLNFSHVPGERSLAAWLRAHFLAPARIVPGSAMPEMAYTEEELDALTLYMLSLRRAPVPEAFWPKDRIQTERFGGREFSGDGETLYGALCAACHGPRGEGMRYAGSPAFPALAGPDFLRLASDDFLAETVRRGRPGRRMPAWGQMLHDGDVTALVEHVRALGGGVRPAADARPPRWVSGDAATGAALFAQNCSRCHGAHGEGGEGVALNNAVLLATATDTYLVETIRGGRAGTLMPAFGRSTPVSPLLADEEIEAIVAHLRTWEVTP